MAAPGIMRIENGAFRENAWIAFCGAEAVLVDPGDDASDIVSAIRDAKADLREILLTHGHVDHISALHGICSAFPSAKVRISALDAQWCFTALNAMPPYKVPPPPDPDVVIDAADGDTFSVGGVLFSVLATPGHSPGSVCYLAEPPEPGASCILFSGDTLFMGSIGRTDFPGGNDAQMKKSLGRLGGLKPDTVILPGHGEPSTIARELAANPYMRHDY